VPHGLEIPCPAIVLPDRRSGQEVSRLLRAKARAFEELDLLRAVRRVKPAVLHAHFGPVGLRALNVARLLGLPLIVSFYGFDVGHAARSEARKRYEALFRYACVTAEGPYLLKQMRALGALRTALLPLQLPDWSCAHPLPRVPSTGSLRLLQVCRLVPKKGADTAIQAVARARNLGVPVRLEIIGEGPERSSLELLSRSLNLTEFISFLGPKAYAELQAAFSRVDALVQPSRTTTDGDTEGGHPAIVLEAQAQGLPVLATRHADIPMVVRHRRTGLLVPEDDAHALADSIGLLWTMDRAKMGALARARSLRRHEPQKVKQLQARIYRAAADRRFASEVISSSR
jgi:glycosyltransferase involved in cell wall biosynthesis